MSRILNWLGRILLALLVILLVVFVVAAAWPAPLDPDVPPERQGAGARSVEPAYSGLQRAFPPLNEPADNPTTPAKAELGRLLFFDPVLSANNDMACATCHHPDLGFADGRATAMGTNGAGIGPERSGGAELTRNAPGLWNVGYATILFWDGREDSLEEQVLIPLTHADEMGAGNTNELLEELQAIPGYVELFEQAFGAAEAVTLENTQRALAAFQRTLVSQNSAFDRYAAGNFEALTPSQRRGLGLFRSAATRCFECHAAPTFASDTFRVIGVPDGELAHDPGRAGVAPDGVNGAFKVPSLRNVALSAPYMHNGAFATLEEVVEFYAMGGGRALSSVQMPNVDPFVLGFTLTEQERADLVAFLFALTDESAMPAIPTSVPSGLPIAPRLDNPAREAVAAHSTDTTTTSAEARDPMTITVEPGETIQQAVDRARPGDTIAVPYAVYHERVVIDLSDIALLGVPNEAGEWPILDGEGQFADGVVASGNNFEIGFFHIRNYTDNGVLVEGATGVHFHDLFVENTGTYGVYPVQSTDVLVERATVTGVDDAGIYAGQCENVIVRDSVAYGNVIGIEIENTAGAEVYNNHVYDNSAGIFMVLLPQLTSKVSTGGKVYNNVTENNNHANFAPPEATAALLPSGLGIFILASDDNEVYGNTVRSNKTAGVAVFNLTIGFDANEIDVGPTPEHNWIHDNAFENNGYDADASVRDLGIPGADILWDGSSWTNDFDEPAATSFPPLLPSSGWPTAVQKAYWRALNGLIALVS